MSGKLKIVDVMHPSPHTIGIQQSLQRAKEMLEELNIRHLPVQSGGKLVGILTDRDINFALAVDGADASDLKVEDAYSAEPYVVSPESFVEEVVRRMAHDHIGCAIVASQGKLVGIFTTVDVCRVLGEVLSGKKEQ